MSKTRDEKREGQRGVLVAKPTEPGDPAAVREEGQGRAGTGEPANDVTVHRGKGWRKSSCRQKGKFIWGHSNHEVLVRHQDGEAPEVGNLSLDTDMGITNV